MDFGAEKYVKTVEFPSRESKVVHHALMFLDVSGVARRLVNEADSAAVGRHGSSYPCFGGPRIVPAGGLGGWAPGATPQPLPDGMGYAIEKGADLVIQIHYHPSGKPETDQSTLGLTFTEESRRGLANMILGPRRIDLPAGASNVVIQDSAVVPQDIELIGITPHAHWLCKEMKVTATLPDGKVEPLIWIKDWDFNWQGQYRYTSSMKLPKGTRVDMRYVYDNSENNPHNPSHPPKRVTFGEQTTNEMAFAFLQVALPSRDDIPAFRKGQLLSRLEEMIKNGDDFSSLNQQAGRGTADGDRHVRRESRWQARRYGARRADEVSGRLFEVNRVKLILAGVVLASVLKSAAFRVQVQVQDAKGKEFAEPGKALCEEWYPKINAALFGQDRPLPFTEIRVIFEPSISQGTWLWRTVIPAYTDGNIIHVNSEYVATLHKQAPADYAGMLIHELTHVNQHYGNTGDAGWLVEGIADYVRHKYFEKDIEPRVDLEPGWNKGKFATQGYLEGYTTTGAFLFWLEVRKDKDLMPILNRALRDGRYSAKLFQERCGAPLDALWREFVAQSRKA